jgi:hypothetical protein
MPIRVKSWRVLKWIARLVAIVLVVQAALLAGQVRNTDVQVYGASFWLVVYYMLLIPSRIMTASSQVMLLRHQPTNADRRILWCPLPGGLR